MVEYYFTSDWHLFHTNIIKYSHRPFSNAEEMNESILNNYFDLVKPGDPVYFLGDFAFANKSRWDKIESILKQLTAHNEFHFILGNHDGGIMKLIKKYASSINRIKEIKIGKQRITLCHYPMVTHNYSHRNAWQLFGHHHRPMENIVPGKKWNVCVDTTNFYPISYTQLESIMSSRESNWDFITPEMEEKRRIKRKLEKSVEDLQERLKLIEMKIKEEINDNTPIEIRVRYLKSRDELKNKLNESKQDLKSLR